jgi:hypothetical protein
MGLSSPVKDIYGADTQAAITVSSLSILQKFTFNIFSRAD